MIEFELKKITKDIYFKKDISLENYIKKSFDMKLVYFYYHKDDNKKFFIKTSIIDFTKGKINYFESFTEKNLEKFKNLQLLNIVYNYNNPHSFIDSGNGKYYCFVDGQIKETSHFYIIDIINLKFYFCNINDLFPDNIFNKGLFTPTPDKAQGLDYIYQIFVSYDENNRKYRRNILKISLIGKKNKILYSSSDFNTFDDAIAPHILKKVGNLLLLSDFLIFDSIKCKLIGKEFNSLNNFYLYILKYYNRYLLLRKNIFNGKLLDKNKILKLFLIFFREIISQDDIYGKLKLYLQKQQLDFASFFNNNKLKPEFNKGVIEVFNLDTQENFTFKTSISTPAHIEMDYNDNSIYISNHAFFRINNSQHLYYLSPASIDKFKIIDGKIIKDAIFQHPTGFRYTSHYIFYHNGRKIIMTIGHPNRIFFIDGNNMELIYYKDLLFKTEFKENDIVFNTGYINMNDNVFQENFVGFNISERNGIIFIKGRQIYLLYDYEKKDIIYSWNNINFGVNPLVDVGGTTHVFKIN